MNKIKLSILLDKNTSEFIGEFYRKLIAYYKKDVLKNITYDYYESIYYYFKDSNNSSKNITHLVFPIEILYQKKKNFNQSNFCPEFINIRKIENISNIENLLESFKAKILEKLKININSKKIILLIRIPFYQKIKVEFNINSQINLIYFSDGIDLGLNLINVDRLLSNIDPNLKISEISNERNNFYTKNEAKINERAQITSNLKNEIEFISSIFKKNKLQLILDAGCGSGRISFELAKIGYKIIAIDLNEKLLEKAKDNLEIYKNNCINNQKKGEENILNQINACNITKNVHFQTGNLFSFSSLKIPLNKINTSNDKSLLKKIFNPFKFNIKSKFEKEIYLSQVKFDSIIITWHTFCEVKGEFFNLLNEIRKVINIGGILIFDYPKNATHKELIGFIPNDRMIHELLSSFGFKNYESKKVNWGVEKTIIVAKYTGIM